MPIYCVGSWELLCNPASVPTKRLVVTVCNNAVTSPPAERVLSQTFTELWPNAMNLTASDCVFSIHVCIQNRTKSRSSLRFMYQRVFKRKVDVLTLCCLMERANNQEGPASERTQWNIPPTQVEYVYST